MPVRTQAPLTALSLALVTLLLLQNAFPQLYLLLPHEHQFLGRPAPGWQKHPHPSIWSLLGFGPHASGVDDDEAQDNRTPVAVPQTVRVILVANPPGAAGIVIPYAVTVPRLAAQLARQMGASALVGRMPPALCALPRDCALPPADPPPRSSPSDSRPLSRGRSATG